MKGKLTKVQAIVQLLEAKGGKASWAEIYKDFYKYYRGTKSSCWQEGIRGVVYGLLTFPRGVINVVMSLKFTVA